MQSTEQQQILRALQAIEQRLDRIERSLEPLASLSQVPALAATVTDIVDGWASERGDVDERVQAAASLLERVSRPDALHMISAGLELALSAPDHVATMLDIADEAMADAGESGLELTHLVGDLKRIALGGLKFATSPELRALWDSGMLDPKVLHTLGLAAQAVSDASEGDIPQAGMFAAMKALRRTHTKRAVGFLLRVAENIGAGLERPAKRLGTSPQGKD